jgi:hypothetical protein
MAAPEQKKRMAAKPKLCTIPLIINDEVPSFESIRDNALRPYYVSMQASYDDDQSSSSDHVVNDNLCDEFSYVR